MEGIKIKIIILLLALFIFSENNAQKKYLKVRNHDIVNQKLDSLKSIYKFNNYVIYQSDINPDKNILTYILWQVEKNVFVFNLVKNRLYETSALDLQYDNLCKLKLQKKEDYLRFVPPVEALRSYNLISAKYKNKDIVFEGKNPLLYEGDEKSQELREVYLNYIGDFLIKEKY